MKKPTLCLLVMLIALIGYSQKKPLLKEQIPSAMPVRPGMVDAEPVKANPITKAVIRPPSFYTPVRDVNIVSIISIGTSANAYSYGYGGGQKSILYANNELNTITHLHRMGGNLDPGGYSGDLGYDISTNGGTTFTNMHECYTATISGGAYYLDAARYPNHGIYNPAGNTNPNNAYVTFFAPTLDETNGSWGGYGYGTAKIGNDTDTNKNLSHSASPYYQYIPEGYDVSEDGIIIAVDVNQDWTSGTVVYQGNLLVSRGVWDDGESDFIFDQSLIDFPTNTENDRPTFVTFAFGPDGQTGWIAIIADNETVTPLTELRYLYPIFIKTSDGGLTWDDPIAVRLDGPDGLPGVLNYLTDEQIAELYDPPLPERDEIPFTTAFDCDLVVDKWGNPHMAVVVGVGGSSEYSIVTASETFAAFDISTTDDGTSWDAWLCGKAKQFRGTFGTDYTEDNRIQACSTPDGGKVFITWLDTPVEGATENNSPDIYARGIDVSYSADFRCLSTDDQGEDAPIDVTSFSEAMWQAYFAVTSRFSLDDGNGTYTIPMSYEALTTPFDPALPVQYKYIQDFQFTDDNFCGPPPAEPEIDVDPTALTIFESTGREAREDDSFTIYNIGDTDLTVSSIVASDQWLLISGFPSTPFVISPDENQTVDVSIDWDLLGDMEETGIITISSDDNDEPEVDVTVTAVPMALPDLVVQSWDVTPSTVEPGGSVSTTCEILNQGSGDAGESLLKYYLSADNIYDNDDTELSSDDVGSLLSGESSDFDEVLVIPANTTPGDWFILFFTDADEEVEETDETNNVSDFLIEVQIIAQDPDLVVLSQTTDPDSVVVGGTVNTSCIVSNQGDGTADESVLKYFLSANSTYEGDDVWLGSDPVPGLEASQESSQDQALVIPANTTPGNWYILFFADADEQVEESDENNNVEYGEIVVKLPLGYPTSINPSLIRVYPVPAKECIVIDGSAIENKIISIEIMNSLGVKVYEDPGIKSRSKQININVNNLISGTYLIKIRLESGVVNKMIMIE